MTNLDRFFSRYRVHLMDSARLHPERHQIDSTGVDGLYENAARQIESGHYSITPAIKETCLDLGIDATYSGITIYLNTKENV